MTMTMNFYLNLNGIGGDNKDNTQWMEQCVKKVMNSGKDKEAAIAVCKTTLKKSKGNKTKSVYRDWETDRKSTRLNSSHRSLSRMPSSA